MKLLGEHACLHIPPDYEFQLSPALFDVQGTDLYRLSEARRAINAIPRTGLRRPQHVRLDVPRGVRSMSVSPERVPFFVSDVSAVTERVRKQPGYVPPQGFCILSKFSPPPKTQKSEVGDTKGIKRMFGPQFVCMDRDEMPAATQQTQSEPDFLEPAEIGYKRKLRKTSFQTHEATLEFYKDAGCSNNLAEISHNNDETVNFEPLQATYAKLKKRLDELSSNLDDAFQHLEFEP